MRYRLIGILLVMTLASMAHAMKARTIEFAGQTWEVRSWGGNPGNGCWNADPESVWVDPDGYLHLKIRQVNGFWCQAEVRAANFATYGSHQFRIVSKLDELDPDLVFGMFLYGGDTHEIDVEVSDSLDSTTNRGSYAVHGPTNGLARLSFPLVLSGSYSTHAIQWYKDGIWFSSWHGHCAAAPCGGVIANWNYTGAMNPLPAHNLRPIINLWINHGVTPTKEHEIIVKDYHFSAPRRRPTVR